MPKLTEDNLTEQPVIEWFKQLGYEYKFGPDISPGGILVERGFRDVILENRLRSALRRLNPNLPEKGIDEAVYKLKNVEHPNLEVANKEVWQMLAQGVKVRIRDESGETKGKIVKVFDFEDILNNEFLVVNQLTIQGPEKIRRPDVVVFINGVPIGIFELKNPRIEEATIQTAYQQLQDYKKDIPEIFKYNQILVISDLIEARYGTISSPFEWFKIWRGIEDPEEKLKGISQLEVLIKGIFQKSRLLDIIENFIVFEADSEKEVSKYTKKICLYHQYFGVNKAVQQTLRACGLLPSSNFSQREKNYRGNFNFSGLAKKSRELRKNQTRTEEILWEALRNRRFLNLKFRRQHQIGEYVVDFYCPECRLVIEIDGGVHNIESQAKKDSKREAYLKSLGNTVLRFSNSEIIEDLNGVLKKIAQFSSPSGRGEGEGYANRSYASRKIGIFSSPSGRGEGEGYANRKIGVLWHTQGSGKTLSMVFYVNKVKKIKELQSPTFVFLTDRNDLDNQFYRTFARSGYAVLAKQAESIKDLKKKLESAGAELIFTTIQKFGEDFGNLSERNNIIVIVDEAHRSQYRELAARVRKSLPNASFMGITATPISLKDRDTELVFGKDIDVYPVSRGVEDKAIVPIYYEGRLAPLHLTNHFIDDDFDKLTWEIEIDAKESLKRKFARLEEIVGAPDRLEKIAKDIVNHFNNRGLEGKAMVVTISRKVAVKMYELISSIENAPEVAVVISKPEEFRDEIKGEIDIREIERRFKDPDDSLKMVVVCDMWLTGFDVPCLSTMYFDKPLKGHNLMQAIARVNRIFKDKPGGLIVDYIGIADDLRKALGIYDPAIRRETMIPLRKVIDKMLEKYDIVKSMLSGVNYSNWRYLAKEEQSHLVQQAFNIVITNPKTGVLDEDRKKKFLEESLKLIKLYSFVMPRKEAYEIKNDVEFIKAVRSCIVKRAVIKGRAKISEDLETTIKELISKSIATEGIIDIFALRKKGKVDISVLDESFLKEIRKSKYKNLAIEILRKLLSDRIKLKIRKNEIRYKSLLELLNEIIEKYEERMLNSSEVIERLIELAKEVRKSENAAKEMGLTEDELAFYDAITSKKAIRENKKVKEIVRELVRAIRQDLTIDWTNHDIIKARIRDHIRLILLKNQFQPKEVEEITNIVYQQAVSLYKNYAPANSVI